MDATDARALADLDAIAQAGLVATGEVSATELLEAAILRLEGARDLNAVIAEFFDRGRQLAAALDASGELRGGGSGPLAGVPFLLKDLGASLAGAPEAIGSCALRTHDRAVAVRADGEPVVAVEAMVTSAAQYVMSLHGARHS